MTEVGGNVVVAEGKLAPFPIDHPNLFQLPLSPAAASAHAIDSLPLGPGGDAPVEAGADADPVPVDDPIRILVTKQTQRDQVIAIQNLLASMGYLEPQRFTGKFGDATKDAIAAFQKTYGMRPSTTVTGELVKAIYAAAGREEPPAGRIFVRQNFKPVLDAAVAIRDPDKALGTHFFIVSQDSAVSHWLALSVEGDSSVAALDRIAMDPPVRREIERRLRPGSVFIVSDVAVDSAILPDGDDFLVVAKSTPEVVKSTPKLAKAVEPKPIQSKVKKAKPVSSAAVAKPRSKRPPSVMAKRPTYRYVPRTFGGGLFSRW
jgi:peptidoglycan hydrolase-like protein with peptidoglycan-binding domain